jgi:hypothetical protein
VCPCQSNTRCGQLPTSCEATRSNRSYKVRTARKRSEFSSEAERVESSKGDLSKRFKAHVSISLRNSFLPLLFAKFFAHFAPSSCLQEPIDPTTGERPPLVQSSAGGPDGTPPASLFSASPTASVELRQRKLEQRNSFLERAKRFSWGSGKEAPRHRSVPGSEQGSQAGSPELFFSPTGDEGEKHIMTSPLVPTRFGGHRRNQSLPPEVEELHIQRPTLAQARKSFSIESRLPEVGATPGTGYKHDPEDGLGHKRWPAMEEDRAREADAGRQSIQSGNLEADQGRSSFQNETRTGQGQAGGEASEVPRINASNRVVDGSRTPSPLGRSDASSSEGPIWRMSSPAAEGSVQLTGKELEQLAAAGDVSDLPDKKAGLQTDRGYAIGAHELKGAPPASQDNDVIALSGTSIESEGADEGEREARSGKGGFAAGLKRLRLGKRRNENGPCPDADMIPGREQRSVPSALASPVWSPAEALALQQMSQDEGDHRHGESQPRLTVSESGLVQIPLASSPDAQLLQPFSHPALGPRDSMPQAVEDADMKWGKRGPDANGDSEEARETPLPEVRSVVAEADGNGSWQTAGGGVGVGLETGDFQTGAEPVPWIPNRPQPNGDVGTESEADSVGSVVDIKEDLLGAVEAVPALRQQGHIPLESVDSFRKFATAAIAAATVSNALASGRGDRAEQFVSSAAGAAAAALLGGDEIVGETLEAVLANANHAARSVSALPFPKRQTLFGVTDVEERPEIDPRAQHPVSGQPEEETYRDSLAHHAKKLSAVEEGEVLGGDLLVRLVSAEDLQGKREHVNPYCVVEVEKQRKRSATRNRTTKPQWNEELAFKAVRTSADLHVSVYSAERVGRDVFLGEVSGRLHRIGSSAHLPWGACFTLDVFRADLKLYVLVGRWLGPDEEHNRRVPQTSILAFVKIDQY